MRYFKYSGKVAPNDQFHQVVEGAVGAINPDQHDIAPTTVNITITNPSPQHMIGVPQYASTVVGSGSGYDPANDCAGYFMSYKFQPNNNCYAYACDIATNSFPQPGRYSGTNLAELTISGEIVQAAAEQDGLTYVGNTIEALKAHASGAAAQAGAGHYVALMISLPGDEGWTGDYHWARCDDPVNFESWSQKDGNDQVTNFDFAGKPITSPATANWTVNQGPISQSDPTEYTVEYAFWCFMFVPSGVNII